MPETGSLPSPATAQTGPSPKRATAVRCPTTTIPGAISRPGGLGDAFGVPGDNYLAIKISYWLPVG